MSPEPLTLFDIPGAEPKQKCWSPNTWKTRYTLNYKGIPYRTEWVEYPDIEALCLRYGTSATSKKADGRPHYTLPMIYDPNTKTAVVESAAIAKYLDKTYPDTPQLFPKGTDALQTSFVENIWPNVGLPLFMIIISRTCKALNPRSAEYFRRTREDMFGSKLEQLGSEEQWKSFEAGLGRIELWLSQNGPEKDILVMGDRVCFADIQLVSLLIWAKVICGEDSNDWKRIEGWNDERWSKLVEYFDQYAAVDNV